ncbi:MAG: hypothetical protein ACOYOE_06095 [Chlorobium sp.]
MKQVILYKNDLITSFQSLSTDECKDLITRRLRGIDDKLPPPEIRIDEDYEDIFIRIIPQIEHPENIFNALINLYESTINEFYETKNIDSIFIAIITMVRILLVGDYKSKFYRNEYVMVKKNELSIKACELTEELQKKLQLYTDEASQHLLNEALALLEASHFISQDVYIDIPSILYSSLSGEN